VWRVDVAGCEIQRRKSFYKMEFFSDPLGDNPGRWSVPARVGTVLPIYAPARWWRE
jgi:hypothetical protein